MIRNHSIVRLGNNMIVPMEPHIHCPKCKCGVKCPLWLERIIRDVPIC